MRVLIVQSNLPLGQLWQRHLERLDVIVDHVQTGEAALHRIGDNQYDAIVLDLVLTDGAALAVADLVQFRQPLASLIFVTDTTFFSDGSIFALSASARALIETSTPPNDLAEIVHHYGSVTPAREASGSQALD